MNKTRILVVEDEAIIAMEIENSLQNHGYEVISIVNNANDAIKKAKEDRPDLILMDIRIQGDKDGIEAAEIIRNESAIPVVFSTAYLDEERIERAKITMPFGYVLKPIQEQDLKVTLEMALYVSKVNAERRKAEQKSIENEKQLQNLFDSMLDAFALHEMIFDDEGEPVDYRFLKVNNAFEKLTGLQSENIIGRTVLEVLPNTEKYWIEKYGEVTVTGNPIRYENHSQELGKYYEVNAYRPAPGQFAVIFRDVTQKKELEIQLRRSHDIVNSIQVGLHIYKLEDSSNDESLRMVFANHASQVITGVKVNDILDKTLDENFPKLRDIGIPQKYVEIVKTQQSAEIGDVYYGDERVSKGWYSIRAFPLMDNHVGVAFEDITREKTASIKLNERVKELNCLYGISSIVDKEGITLDEILQEILNLIPSACQYPDSTCARMTVNSREFITDDFRETVWKQSSVVKVKGKESGYIDVFLLDEKPEIEGERFLKEEKSLMDAIAERVGKIIERKCKKNGW